MFVLTYSLPAEVENPLVWLTKSLIVIPSDLLLSVVLNQGKYLIIGAYYSTFPSFISCLIAKAVKVLVIEPKMKGVLSDTLLPLELDVPYPFK